MNKGAFETVEALPILISIKKVTPRTPYPVSHIWKNFVAKTSSRWANSCCGPATQGIIRFIGLLSRRTAFAEA